MHCTYGAEACSSCLPGYRAARAIGRIVRAQLARRHDTHVHDRAWLVCALSLAGFRWRRDGFRGWPDRGCGATGNPASLAWALAAYSPALSDADPVEHWTPCGGSDDRQTAATAPACQPWHPVWPDSRPSTGPGGRFDHLTLAIRIYHNRQHHDDPHPAGDPRRLFDGSDATIRRPVSPASRSTPALRRPFPRSTTAITHLRDVLGDATYRIPRPRSRR